MSIQKRPGRDKSLVPKVKSRTTWNAWGGTHPGRQRENNEDRIHCDAARGIFIVVDGMGGEAAGEEAAQHALACIRKRLGHQTGTISRRIREAITAANNEIYRLSQSNPEWRGMACVLTTAVVENGSLHIGHVGDTRLYIIRNHRIRKATEDHSPVGRREDAGEMTELEAMRHPRRNEVYRDVGSKTHRPDDEDFIDYIEIPFEHDCAVLLCSDGLSDMLTSAEILKTVEENAGNPQNGVHALIELANEAGGKDNVSVIIAEGKDFAPADPGAAPAIPVADANPPEARTGSGRRTSRILRTFAGPWYIFVYGLLCGVLLFSLLQWRFQAVQPDQETPPAPSAPRPQVWHVNPTSSEYLTIGQAIEKALPGDRIEVAAGEYREILRLKTGINVIANSTGEAVLRPPSSLPGDGAVVVADGVRGGDFSGFVIRGGTEAAFPIGIRIVNSDLRVLNVEVSGATRAGIWVDGESDAALIGNFIHMNTGGGIVVAGFSKPRVLNNMIRGNGGGKTGARPGIQIIENADPEVQRNAIFENAAEGIRVPNPRMREKMMNNIFTSGGKPNKAGTIGVEKTGIR